MRDHVIHPSLDSLISLENSNGDQSYKRLKPRFIDWVSILFREAWHKLGKMSKEEAMKKYVEVVCRVDSGWETTPIDPAAQQVHVHAH